MSSLKLSLIGPQVLSGHDSRAHWGISGLIPQERRFQAKLGWYHFHWRLGRALGGGFLEEAFAPNEKTDLSGVNCCLQSYRSQNFHLKSGRVSPLAQGTPSEYTGTLTPGRHDPFISSFDDYSPSTGRETPGSVVDMQRRAKTSASPQSLHLVSSRRWGGVDSKGRNGFSQPGDESDGINRETGLQRHGQSAVRQVCGGLLV